MTFVRTLLFRHISRIRSLNSERFVVNFEAACFPIQPEGADVCGEIDRRSRVAGGREFAVGHGGSGRANRVYEDIGVDDSEASMW